MKMNEAGVCTQAGCGARQGGWGLNVHIACGVERERSTRVTNARRESASPTAWGLPPPRGSEERPQKEGRTEKYFPGSRNYLERGPEMEGKGFMFVVTNAAMRRRNWRENVCRKVRDVIWTACRILW